MGLPVARRVLGALLVFAVGPAARAQTGAPDFVGSINDPAYQDVKPGETATYTITIESIKGFAGRIEFSASGLPRGAMAIFTPKTMVGSGIETVTIQTSKVTPRGSYLIEVSGTSEGITHSGGITLNVGAGHPFEDFGGTVTPVFQTITPGGSTTYQISIFPINGFTQSVRLGISGLPPTLTATFRPSVLADGAGSAVLTVSAASSTATGTYRLRIEAAGGGEKHSNTVAVNVGPPGMDFTDFTGSVEPLSRTVKAGESVTYTVNIQPLYGTGCVTLQTLDILPGSSAMYDPATAICGGPASTILTVMTTPQTPPGEYTITIEGFSSGGFTHSKNIMLSVTP